MPHNKTFKLRAPLDKQAYALDILLTNIARDGLKGAAGSYIGTGVSGQAIAIPFFPTLLIISPVIDLATSATTISGSMIFTFSANVGASWIPGTGFKKDCVLTITKDAFTIGTNAAVNTAAGHYLYFIIG